MCSTPRGITGKIAKINVGVFLAFQRAQRLAASPEKSHIDAALFFGPVKVLNASRHHRKNRQARILLGRRRTRGAQRLAASPEKSLIELITNSTARRCSTPRGITGKIAWRRFPASSPLLSAQRLAASPEKSPVRDLRLQIGHQGAQRLAASPEKSPVIRPGLTSRHWCSTPRGITGKIAWNLPCHNVSCPTCSTPRGITGKIAMRPPSRSATRRGAQRLAASPEKSRWPLGKRLGLRTVLNASRHHRKNRCAHLIHWEYMYLQSRLRASPPFFGFSAAQAETEIGNFLFSSYLTAR